MKKIVLALIRICPNHFKWPLYVFLKYTIGVAKVEVNGSLMKLDLFNDDGFSKEVYLAGVREPLTVQHLITSGILSEGDTVLDIGANIGYYALLESQLVDTIGTVYAVEPVPANHKLLNDNLRLNAARNIVTFQMAFGKEEGFAPMYVRNKKNLSSLTELPDDKYTVTSIEEVPITTVDAFAQRHIGHTPHFIRMDVEGFEADIFEGMQETMKTATLLVEFHPSILTDEQKGRILHILTEHKYTDVTVTVNPKGPWNFIIRFLNRQLGNKPPQGVIQHGDLDTLRSFLYTSPRVFNAFLSH